MVTESHGNMEELVYAIWKRPEGSTETFMWDMLGRTAMKLRKPGAQWLSVNLADEFSVYPQGMRITRMQERWAQKVFLGLTLSARRRLIPSPECR
jgi:hypothetical protein